MIKVTNHVWNTNMIQRLKFNSLKKTHINLIPSKIYIYRFTLYFEHDFYAWPINLPDLHIVFLNLHIYRYFRRGCVYNLRHSTQMCCFPFEISILVEMAKLFSRKWLTITGSWRLISTFLGNRCFLLLRSLWQCIVAVRSFQFNRPFFLKI